MGRVNIKSASNVQAERDKKEHKEKVRAVRKDAKAKIANGNAPNDVKQRLDLLEIAIGLRDPEVS